MIDIHTGKPIRVSTESPAGPYIRFSADQIDSVRQLLQANDIPHWVEHLIISVDDKPFIGVINLGRKVDPEHVQAILDAA
jgi:hypothetical protein